MGSYDTWILLMVAPALWWLMAMVRAVMDVRDRTVTVIGDSSAEDSPSYR